MALGSTQPLTEMSTRNFSLGGKDGRCVGLTTLPPSCASCLEIWEPQPPGTFWACRPVMGLLCLLCLSAHAPSRKRQITTVGCQCGTCFTSSFWCLEFRCRSQIFLGEGGNLWTFVVGDICSFLFGKRALCFYKLRNFFDICYADGKCIAR